MSSYITDAERLENLADDVAELRRDLAREKRGSRIMAAVLLFGSLIVLLFGYILGQLWWAT